MSIHVTITNFDSVAQQLFGTDGNGVQWFLNTFDGWDGPEVRQDLHPLLLRNGDRIGQWVYGPRPMTLGGHFHAPTETLMWATRDKLAQASSGLQDAFCTLTVAETGRITKSVQVLRADRLQMRTITDKAVEFLLPLTAPDPAKYSTTVSSFGPVGNGTSFVTTNGTFQTDPTITIQGPASGETVSLTGVGTLILLGSLGGGDTVVANFANRTVTLNGVSRFDLVGPATTWFSLRPGSNQMFIVGDGTVSFQWQDAFI